ncbi:ABC transporter permease [Rhizomonospora bruguierae]|uniref:ABC transporter permease n=1 Tax=Rhizomonospora bruguierae TaxID=1581705 RepID=UPI001BD11C1C|nr:ABC transporter permease [Micromonospora sp. NBRC 107566]
MTVSAPRRTAWPVALLAVTRRHALATIRTPAVVIMSVVQSVVFLLIFRYVFGGAIGTGGLDYVQFLAPGLLVVSMLFSVIGVGGAVAEDMGTGVTDRLKSLPIAPSAALVGRVLAQLGLSAVTLLATAAIAVAVGFRPGVGFAGLLGVLGWCLLVALTFGWVFILAGVATRDVQSAQGIGFVVLPLTFVSGAFVPAGSMPDWLRGFADNQPVTVLVAAARWLAHGDPRLANASHGGGYYVLVGLTWMAAILLAAAVAAVSLYRRR